MSCFGISSSGGGTNAGTTIYDGTGAGVATGHDNDHFLDPGVDYTNAVSIGDVIRNEHCAVDDLRKRTDTYEDGSYVKAGLNIPRPGFADP
jgi:hypothetical protein